MLAKAQAALEARGLRDARLRRVALSAFSAGYGAVRGLLNQPGFTDKVDAVLLLDGIHTGYMPLDHSLDMERLKPFSRFAEQAAAGKKLMSITHSEITPNGDYAGTHESTDALLKLTGAQRSPGAGARRAGGLRPDRGGGRGETPVRPARPRRTGARSTSAAIRAPRSQIT